MGHRTLTWQLVLRALALDSDAYDRLRDDDNPFVEGLFLLVIVSAGTALLNLIGQVLAWASFPSIDAIKQIVLRAYESASWWQGLQQSPEALAIFNRIWDAAWQVLPMLFGAPDPRTAAANILLWPLTAALGWLIYGLLAHIFARMLGGQGNVGQTLGVLGLSYAPVLLRGLGFIPFLVIGSVINTWQLLCRYRALRSVHRLSWGRAVWATILPFFVYLMAWMMTGAIAIAIISTIAGAGR